MAESVISNTAGMGVLRHKGCKGEPSSENTDGGRRETPAVFAAWDQWASLLRARPVGWSGVIQGPEISVA
jgi:hypothetical protein